MDPFTQGLLGATAARASRRNRHPVLRICLLGFLAGMAADLDVLIRSSSDDLLFLEYHRQFTHSLVFIPIGGLLAGLILYPPLAKPGGISLAWCIVYCTLGYATHAVLDACTTYGTMLFWPFSKERVAWNSMSIIDPLYTVPIALLLLLSCSRSGRWAAPLALCWALAYPCAGWVQSERAKQGALALAEARGHAPDSLETKPSFGNILLWKSVYRHDGQFYVDAIRAGRSMTIIEGQSIPELEPQRDLPWLQAESRQARDLSRFTWFSKGYVALDPNSPTRVIDIRYSLLPHEINALWSIELSPSEPDSGVRYNTHREDSRSKGQQLWQMVWNGEF